MQTGKITAENRIHDLDIKDMRFSKDGTHFITASGDRTSKIVDAQDLTVMKEFAFERPANAADMSPIADHVRLQLRMAPFASDQQLLVSYNYVFAAGAIVTIMLLTMHVGLCVCHHDYIHMYNCCMHDK